MRCAEILAGGFVCGFFWVCFILFCFSVTIPQPSTLWSSKNNHAEPGEELYFLASVLVYGSLRSLWNYCSRLKSQICSRKKRHRGEDFTSEINLNKGVQVQTGSWEARRHKHGVLSYQAVAFMGEMESSYLHCWLSYKVYRNADLCDVCFMQRV